MKLLLSGILSDSFMLIFRRVPILLLAQLIVCTCLITACTESLPEDIEKAYASLPETVDYNFDVKPILSDRCYQCHGPDVNTRKAGLRLDIEESAFSALANGNRAFVKSKPGKSEAYHRIISTDPEYMMPPPDSKLALTPRETAIIVKWIEQGAKWKPHWAFIPVEKPAVPSAPDNGSNLTPLIISFRISSVRSKWSRPHRLIRNAFFVG